jgi:hypothetical protein
MKKIGIAATVAAALAASTVATPAEAAPERKPGHRSLAKVLAADGTRFDHSWKDFDVLEKAVLTVLDAKPDSQVKVLTQGRKRVTAFIPTDAAFRRLSRTSPERSRAPRGPPSTGSPRSPTSTRSRRYCSTTSSPA